MPTATKPPLVVHLIYKLAVGGLENGLTNLIDHMPPERFRHVIVCLTDYTDFRSRLRRTDVPVVALHKREGTDLAAYLRLWRLLRDLRPDIMHTRTLGTLDGQFYAALAGVPVRVHGEHGRASADVEGSVLKHRLLRGGMAPLIHQYTAVSRDLADFLRSRKGIRPDQVTLVYNGVDTRRFHPRLGGREGPWPPGFAQENSLVLGTVGRMEGIKDQPTLVLAFLRLLSMAPQLIERVRLVLIGSGSLLDRCRRMLAEANASHLAWIPGERDDVPGILRALDLFVLPSLSEGTSNTILEAMASGLPMVATNVGGNPELVIEGCTGMLVPPADPHAMARAICSYCQDSAKRQQHGRAARERAEAQFSMESMVNGYVQVYDTALAQLRAGRQKYARNGVDELLRRCSRREG